MGLYMLFLRTCLAANLTSLVCASMYFKTLFLENTCLHPSLSYSFSFVYTLMMQKLTHKRKSLTTLVAIMFPFCIHFLKCLYKLTTIRGTHILCEKLLMTRDLHHHAWKYMSNFQLILEDFWILQTLDFHLFASSSSSFRKIAFLSSKYPIVSTESVSTALSPRPFNLWY